MATFEERTGLFDTAAAKHRQRQTSTRELARYRSAEFRERVEANETSRQRLLEERELTEAMNRLPEIASSNPHLGINFVNQVCDALAAETPRPVASDVCEIESAFEPCSRAAKGAHR